MMPDDTLWAFLALLTSGITLGFLGAWLLHISWPRTGGRVMFVGCMAYLYGVMVGLSLV